ncbi:MAG: biotin-dependent carboxyltransferase family protein [Gemmatimonadetes bacterium]|nr:biotin-dependent carboxyltransferase family protein [Gemmatimonadota bacterium]MYD14443.1 biotin-dependent carboxyltransferase family protein [Gemmatimonadota bacterium]MYI65736.1 biotin-dependent carboxyltransferase family protein [Gemmatimonadota bacterium]
MRLNAPDRSGAPHGVVDRPGPYCTVQDLGRTSGLRAGLAPGGAMDQRAYLWANRLLDNDPRAAALEVTLGGLALTFAVETVVALTGADCAATLDGVEMGGWRTIRARPGQVLRLAYSATGMRAYLAFPGGLATDRAFGSASGVARDGLPGLLGRPLLEGERLRWADPHRVFPNRHVPAHLVPPASAEQPVILPLIVGYEWSEFSEADRKSVFGEEWTIGPASDRTAIRLDGPELASGPETLDSSPLVDGTVQVTGDSRPLVFMRDRPTIGGYPKLGGTDLISLDTLAQARPGSPVRFVRAVPAALRRAMVRREEFFEIR